MTHDDLMRLAYEAGAKDHPNPDQWGILTISHDDIERLAAFVMLYEREECAKLADSLGWVSVDNIRARKEK
jgi:hypothetical protein